METAEKYRVESWADLAIITLEGEIDLHESPEVRQAMAPLIDKKVRRIYLDMAAVEYIDSSALAVFIDGMQRIAKYGGKFALVAIRPVIKKVLEIACLDQIFTVYPDKASALAAV